VVAFFSIFDIRLAGLSVLQSCCRLGVDLQIWGAIAFVWGFLICDNLSHLRIPSRISTAFPCVLRAKTLPENRWKSAWQGRLEPARS
jgi:hypothetical protein